MDLGASSFWRPPVPGPALDLVNFTLGTLDSRVTLTRASTAWAFNSAGTLTSYATNLPRFDYDPLTLAAKGLLLEEARTNSLRNNSMTGVVAGTSGTLPTNWVQASTATGITRTIVGSGTVNGLPYVDIKYAGTATAAATVLFFESTTGVSTVNATTWTTSAFVALVAGSLTNITAVKNGHRFRGAAGASLGAQMYETTIVPTSTLTRYATTGTGADATIASVVHSFELTMASGAVDVTIRIAAPQLELGAFATSPILTTTVAVTRAIDVFSSLTSAFPFNANEGTLFVAFTPSGVTGLQTAIYLDDGTSNERMGVRASSASLAGVVVDGGVSQASVTDGTLTTTATKAVLAYKLNDIALCVNGAAVGTDTSATLPTVTKLLVGTRLTGSESLSGWYTRASYYNRRLDNATLLRITT